MDGGRVVVTPGEPKATIVSLDKHTGKLLLSASVPETSKGSSRADYASLVVATASGRRVTPPPAGPPAPTMARMRAGAARAW